ncbi:MAG: right-handed parallel beta-helix repeat-containing protein [Nanoarchaeota archaeon]
MKTILLLLVLSLAFATAQAVNCGGSTVCACGDLIVSDYQMNANITCPTGDGLVLGNNGITLDCRGHSINGNHYNGVAISAGRNLTMVKNCTAIGWFIGIGVSGSNNTITQNRLISDREGISVDNVFYVAANNTLLNNSFFYNTHGIHTGTHSNATRIVHNYLSTNNCTGIEVQGAGNKVHNNTLFNSSYIVQNWLCSVNDDAGIIVERALFTSVYNNTVLFGHKALRVELSNFTNITNNSIVGNYFGIDAQPYVNNLSITENTILARMFTGSSTTRGVSFFSILENNTLSWNYICGHNSEDVDCASGYASGTGNNFSRYRNEYGRCSIGYGLCPCEVYDALLEPCPGGTCDEGESMVARVAYSSTCIADRFQLSLKSVGNPECVINYTKQNMTGINGTCSNGECTSTWTVPHIPQACFGKTMQAQEVFLYPPGEPIGGTPETYLQGLSDTFDLTSCYRPIDNDQIFRNLTLCTDHYALPQGITIISNYTTIDCQQATLEGLGYLQSLVDIRYRKNITVSNCRLKTYEYGIFIHMSSNVEVRGSHFDQTPSVGSGRNDIRVQSNGPEGNSGNISIHDNTFINSQFGILLAYLNDTNRVFNNHFYNITGSAIWFYGPRNWASNGALDVYDNVVERIGLIYSGAGVWVEEGDNARIYANNISRTEPGNGRYGIHLIESTNIEIFSNILTNVTQAIRMENADLINVHDNVLSSSSYGIYLSDGSSSNILNNNVACDNALADLRCLDAPTSASGAGNTLSIIDDPLVLCVAVASSPCVPCTLDSARIEETSCTDLICEEGESVQMTAAISGNCPQHPNLQVNAQGGSCAINHLGDMVGIDGALGPTAQWAVPPVPDECRGELVMAADAELWDGPVSTGTLLSTTSNVQGWLIMSGNPPTMLSCDDAPDPVAVFEEVLFTMWWSGFGATTLYACDEQGFSQGACTNWEFCQASVTGGVGSCSFVPQPGDEGMQDYSLVVCNAIGCSAACPGQFTVVEPANCNSYLGCFADTALPGECYYDFSIPFGPAYHACCSSAFYDTWQSVVVYT